MERKVVKLFLMIFILIICINDKAVYAESFSDDTSNIVMCDKSEIETINDPIIIKESDFEDSEPMPVNSGENNSNKNDFLSRFLFEFIGPIVTTVLAVLVATHDDRKKNKEREKNNRKKAQLMRTLLDGEIEKIQQDIKTIDENTAYDYRTPIWDIVSNSNIIDYFSDEDLVKYINRYLSISRLSALELLLIEYRTKGHKTDQEKNYYHEIESLVRKARSEISNGKFEEQINKKGENKHYD